MEEEKINLTQLLPFLEYYEIFNDPEDGFSYDICPTRVESGYELEVSWQLPPCFALNRGNYPDELCYPGRSSFIKLFLTNHGSQNYVSQTDDDSLPILKLEFFIDGNDDLKIAIVVCACIVICIFLIVTCTIVDGPLIK